MRPACVLAAVLSAGTSARQQPTDPAFLQRSQEQSLADALDVAQLGPALAGAALLLGGVVLRRRRAA